MFWIRGGIKMKTIDFRLKRKIGNVISSIRITTPYSMVDTKSTKMDYWIRGKYRGWHVIGWYNLDGKFKLFPEKDDSLR